MVDIIKNIYNRWSVYNLFDHYDRIMIDFDKNISFKGEDIFFDFVLISRLNDFLFSCLQKQRECH
jgi:hypothetical protein